MQLGGAEQTVLESNEANHQLQEENVQALLHQEKLIYLGKYSPAKNEL